MLRSLFESVHAMPSSIALRESLYGYILLLTLHVVSLALFAGIVILLDLRLTRMAFTRLPVSQIWTRMMLPWMAVGLAVNLALSLMLMERLGIMAPAVGLVAHSLLNMFYFAAVVLHLYGLSLRELLRWKQVGTLLGIAILCTTILLLAERWIGSPVLAALTGTTVYLGAYVFLCTTAKIADVTYIVRHLPGAKLLV